MRVRGQRRGRAELPDALRSFVLADWYDADEPVPLREGADLGEVPWRCLQANLRWREAGRDWLAGSGLDASPAGWRRAVEVSDWSADPHRLAREVRGAA